MFALASTPVCTAPFSHGSHYVKESVGKLVTARAAPESTDVRKPKPARFRPPLTPIVSVIVPTRNESGNVGPLVALLDGVLAERDMEVVFVDDSDDGTDAVVREMAPAENRDIVLIHREREQRTGGLGGAVVAGLRAARAPWACVMDADLQHPPALIADLFDRAERGDVDIVVASRFCGGGSADEVGPLRRMLSRVSMLAAKLLFAEQLDGVTDPMSGFFMVRRDAVDADALRPQGFKILLELLVRMRGLRKAEVPFTFGIRHSGESKSGAKEGARYLKQLWDLRFLQAASTLMLGEGNARFTLSAGGRTGCEDRFRAPLIRAPAAANGATVARHSGGRLARLTRRAQSARGWDLLTGQSQPRIRPAIDLALLYLAVAAASPPADGDGLLTHSTLLLAYPPLVVAVTAARGVYTRRTWASSLDATGAALVASVIATMAYVTATTFAGVPADDMPRVLDAALLATAVVCATTGGLQLLRRWARRTGRTGRRALIVGAGVVGARVATRLCEHPEYGLVPVGVLDAEPDAARAELTVAMVGRPQQVVEAAADLRAEHVIVAFTRAPDQELVELVRRCDEAGLEVSLVPRLFESVNERFELQRIGTLPLMALRNIDPKGWQFTLKYALDRIIAAVLLIVLAPLLLAVAAAVKLTSPGPVLFRQRRVGLDGQDFDLLKFRSMHIGDDTAGFELVAGMAPGGIEGTDRRTAIGKLIRRTFIDELPQLINVLRGEMSLVGPRPERPHFVALFSTAVNRYGDRHRIKSGITGWAQVHGLRGQTPLAERVELDNYYIDNWSPAMDLKILALTVMTFISNGWDT
jgi:exopolysaccharide biosynthesis polyprenyl glycosylphosphotransferase